PRPLLLLGRLELEPLVGLPRLLILRGRLELEPLVGLPRLLLLSVPLRGEPAERRRHLRRLLLAGVVLLHHALVGALHRGVAALGGRHRVPRPFAARGRRHQNHPVDPREPAACPKPPTASPGMPVRMPARPIPMPPK